MEVEKRRVEIRPSSQGSILSGLTTTSPEWRIAAKKETKAVLGKGRRGERTQFYRLSRRQSTSGTFRKGTHSPCAKEHRSAKILKIRAKK